MKYSFTALFLIIFFAPVGFGMVIDHVSLQSTDRTSTVLISTNSPLIPNLRFNARESCWIIDFIGTTLNKNIHPVAPGQGPLKLLQMDRVCSSPLVERISFFVNPGASVKVRRILAGIQIIFKSPPDGQKFLSPKVGPSPQPLLSPAGNGEEIVLDMTNTSTVALVTELARQANIDVKFRDLPPRKTTIRTRCADPKTALEKICRSHGMVLTSEGDGWWITRKGACN